MARQWDCDATSELIQGPLIGVCFVAVAVSAEFAALVGIGGTLVGAASKWVLDQLD
jgi:hypothetical protein